MDMTNEDEIKWDGIDGKRFEHSLAAIYEAQMWEDIARHRRENPNLFNLRLGDKVVGKAIFTSTVDEPDNNYSIKSLWDDSEKSNGLYRIFRPQYFNPKEDEDKNL